MSEKYFKIDMIHIFFGGVSVVALRIFHLHWGIRISRCSMWGLIPLIVIETGPPALERVLATGLPGKSLTSLTTSPIGDYGGFDPICLRTGSWAIEPETGFLSMWFIEGGLEGEGTGMGT